MDGMIAIGDSLVNGRTPDLAGIPGKSWARWVAEAAGIPYQQFAKGGLTSAQIVADLLPHVKGKYAYGVFNMGTNDVLIGWDENVFRRNVETTAERMAETSDQVIMLSVPYSADANKVMKETAVKIGALFLDAGVKGPRLLGPDRIHPTAHGQLAIADRAAALLGTPLPSVSAPVAEHLGIKYMVEYYAKFTYLRVKSIARKMLPRTGRK